jgi:hypothetical protein
MPILESRAIRCRFTPVGFRHKHLRTHLLSTLSHGTKPHGAEVRRSDVVEPTQEPSNTGADRTKQAAAVDEEGRRSLQAGRLISELNPAGFEAFDELQLPAHGQSVAARGSALMLAAGAPICLEIDGLSPLTRTRIWWPPFTPDSSHQPNSGSAHSRLSKPGRRRIRRQAAEHPPTAAISQPGAVKRIGSEPDRV